MNYLKRVYKREKIAVIGGGIAGVLSARLLSTMGYEVMLFEKGNKLGGCAGSFTRNSIPFNIAATTIGGLYDDFPLNRLFELLSFVPHERCSLVLHNPSFLVKLDKKTISLGSDPLELFEELAYLVDRPVKTLVSLISDNKKALDFLKIDPFFHLKNFFSKIKTFINLTPFIFKYYNFIKKPALRYLREVLGSNVNQALLKFFEAFSLITTQSNLVHINALCLHLALGYPLTGIGMVLEGNEALFKALVEGVDYHLECEVKSIKRCKDKKGFILKTSLGEENFSKLVVAFPVLENFDIFIDEEIKNYFKSFASLKSKYSALVVYGCLKNFHYKTPHFLIITDNSLQGLTSGNYLISFLKPHLNQNLVSFTLSTHTPLEKWNKIYLEKPYTELKEEIKEEIEKILVEHLNISKENIIVLDVATPLTFKRYLNRESLGGIPITAENTPFKVPPNVTPFPGLYLISDQSLFYQGWIGIAMGVMNLFNWWRYAGV